LRAYKTVDDIATSEAKRDYYRKGGRRGNTYNPNSPPPGWGGGPAAPTVPPSLGRRVTNALGVTSPSGPSVGQQIGGALGIGGSGNSGSFNPAGGYNPAASYDPSNDPSLALSSNPYDPNDPDFMQTYEEGGRVEDPLVLEQRDRALRGQGDMSAKYAPIRLATDRMPPMESYPRRSGYPAEPELPPSALPAALPITPRGNRPRPALSDQTRTEAYDPALDGPTSALPIGQNTGGAPVPVGSAPNSTGMPVSAGARTPGYNPNAGGEGTSPNARSDLEQAIDGGLRFAQQVFHLDNSNVAVGNDPHTARGTEALMKGVGAAPAELVQKASQVVNAGLPPQLLAQLGHVRTLETLYRWRSANGDKAGADKAAFEILQYSAGIAAQFGQQAVQQYRAGDIEGSKKSVQTAYNQIPDGRHLDVKGNVATVVDTRTGQPVQQFQFTPEQVLNTALGLSSRSLYWQLLVQRVSTAGGKASNRTESQQDLDKARADYYRARTGQVGVRRGGGAPAGPSAATQSIIERINAIPRPGAAPNSASAPAPTPAEAAAPLRQEGDDSGGGGDDDDEDRALNAPPDLKDGPPGGSVPGVYSTTAPDSVLRLKRPQPGSGSNPPPSPATGGGGGPAPSPGVGGRQPAGITPAPSPTEVAAGAKAAVPQTDGSISTEKSIGVEVDGKHYVIPTIVNGRSLTPDTAVALFKAGKNAPLGEFASQEEATQFAEQRSRDLDRAFGGQGDLKKGPSSPAGDSSDPDAVPPVRAVREGNRYVLEAKPEQPKKFDGPKTFDEPRPGDNPLRAVQADAAKLTNREGGPATRQLLNSRIKEWDDYAKGWEKRKKDFETAEAKRKKDFETAETKRVTQEHKEKLAQQKADAKATYDLKLKPAERVKLTESVNAEFDKAIERAKDTTNLTPEEAEAKKKAFATSIYTDPKVDPTRFKALAMDLMTSNPNPDAVAAVRMVYDLTRIDPQDATFRTYKPQSFDVLDNVVVISKAFGPIHIRPQAYKELTGIIKDRLGRGGGREAGDVKSKEGALAAAKKAGEPNSWNIGQKVGDAISERAEKVFDKATTVGRPEGRTLGGAIADTASGLSKKIRDSARPDNSERLQEIARRNRIPYSGQP